MPWPSSTRPVMTVTVPSGATRTQASSWGLFLIMGGTGGPACVAGVPWAAGPAEADGEAGGGGGGADGEGAAARD